ncbi:hypothetical protein LINPERHAP2_LOCUS34745 [Linum perenne]
MFEPDPDYAKNEKRYEDLKRNILLGEDDDDDDDDEEVICVGKRKGLKNKPGNAVNVMSQQRRVNISRNAHPV